MPWWGWIVVALVAILALVLMWFLVVGPWAGRKLMQRFFEESSVNLATAEDIVESARQYRQRGGRDPEQWDAFVDAIVAVRDAQKANLTLERSAYAHVEEGVDVQLAALEREVEDMRERVTAAHARNQDRPHRRKR